MKTSNLIKLTVVTGAMLALTSTVRAGLVGSGNPHDFHSYSWANSSADPKTVCGVCHVPHNADKNLGPLWGHSAISANSWTMYGVGRSPGASTRAGVNSVSAPSASSLACLSCHDGSIAVDAYGNNPIDPLGTWKLTNNAAISEGTKTLTHSHPISFDYQSLVGTGPTQDRWLFDSASPYLVPDAGFSQWNAPNGSSIASLLLDSAGKVECNSCHDVHGQDGTAYDPTLNPKLLKLSGTQNGAGSLLCRSCHNK